MLLGMTENGGLAMSQILNRPREIIDFCLKPLGLDPKAQATREAYQRLEHVIRTYQTEMLKVQKPVAVDFSKMPTITINESAHGDD
jgi:hypothetical protein